MSDIAKRIAAAGIILPAPKAPLFNYVPWLFSGNHLYISGQVSQGPDGGITGTVGRDVDMVQATAAARLCGISLLVQINDALQGRFERVARIARLTGFVQCAEDFGDMGQVINGCSDLMVEVFGERGRHTRSSVGVFRLPRDFAVEVDAIVEVTPA